MKKHKESKKKLIILLIATLLLGSLLIFSVVKFFDREGGISFGGIIRAETFYILLIFLLLIPLLLLGLLMVLWFGKNKSDADGNTLVVSENKYRDQNAQPQRLGRFEKDGVDKPSRCLPTPLRPSSYAIIIP